jgi:hypothetical protein
MALITIKDLPQNDALDREARRSIVGGGRTGAPAVQVAKARADSGRIVDYPPGFGRQGSIPASSQRPLG